VTTLHTGHAPGELISGQTLVVKTSGNTVKEALVALQENGTQKALLQKNGMDPSLAVPVEVGR
jgi:hypothetical protein